MVYKDFKGKRISALGLGAMRLPVIDGQAGQIDEEAAAEMVAYAMANGINYYDTAWSYHDSQSEIVLGKILKKYPRDSFYLATKFPGFDTANFKNGIEIFEKQLEKCQVDYFDFYLLHNVNPANLDFYMNDEGGVLSYLLEQKKAGRIRHLGFSVHGDYDCTKRFLEACGEYMEFCQIQLNWIDYDFQEARRKVELLAGYGIPVWVMEPLRGGRLATIPAKYEEQLKVMRPDETVCGWAFRFIQTIPGVVVTLSGMSDMEQLKANIETFKVESPLTEAEWAGLMDIAEEMKFDKTVPCTACRYCTTYCPKGLDIPTLLASYNDNALTGRKLEIAGWTLGENSGEKGPGACIACKSCEAVCPQEIKISKIMEKMAEAIV